MSEGEEKQRRIAPIFFTISAAAFVPVLLWNLLALSNLLGRELLERSALGLQIVLYLLAFPVSFFFGLDRLNWELSQVGVGLLAGAGIVILNGALLAGIFYGVKRVVQAMRDPAAGKSGLVFSPPPGHELSPKNFH